MANNLGQLLPALFVGEGGSFLTQEQINERRAMAEALSQGGGDPAFNDAGWLGVLGRTAEGAYAGWNDRTANRAEQANREYDSGLLQSLMGGFGGSSASPSIQTTGAPSAPVERQPLDYASQRVSQAHGDASPMSAYRDAIASIESAGSGDYQAVGPTHSKLGRALGRYQIMEANIGPWSREVLGREVTPDEFMANPAIQDAIFDGKFGGYIEQFGPEGAAQAWFAGPGGVGKTNRKDVLGTDVGSYGQKFMNALGPQASNEGTQAIAQALSGGATHTMPDETVMPGATHAEATQQPVQVAENEADVVALENIMAQQDPQAFNSPSQQPVQVAQAGGINPAIIQALADPRASDQTRGIAQMLLQQQMQQNDPMRQLQLEKAQLEVQQMRNPQQEQTAEMRNLAWRAEQAGLQPGTQEYADFILSGGKGPESVTNVTTNVGGGDKFYENLDKAQGDTFASLSEQGINARTKLRQVERLGQLLQSAPTGGVAMLKQAAGDYGINTEGLDDIQAAQALINELVPQQRPPGSGPMSDADLELFKRSLPRIINQPGGNQKILQTMRGIAEYQIQLGDIADAVANREMSPKEAREAMRGLANPLEGFLDQEKQAGSQDNDGWREIAPGVRVKRVD